MTVVVPISKRGTVTLPPALRRKFGLGTENPLVIIEKRDRELVLRPIKRAAGSQLPGKSQFSQHKVCARPALRSSLFSPRAHFSLLTSHFTPSSSSLRIHSCPFVKFVVHPPLPTSTSRLRVSPPLRSRSTRTESSSPSHRGYLRLVPPPFNLSQSRTPTPSSRRRVGIPATQNQYP
jgi:bifunctional DNA-binding transcriptional regulator/antitoxin component of YhaV-PrlF toxin-antitoxin module